MIDICDFAVGLSRQLYGQTMPSERPGHRLMETWHPLGVVGVISAFNFPVAVWSWNAAIALVCGDTVVWKPSEMTPLTALACQALLERAAGDVGAPQAADQADPRRPRGRRGAGRRPAGGAVERDRVGADGRSRSAPRVAARFGRVLLELGGNNAAIVTPSADLELAVRGIVFAAAGTAGQRCTTMRRLIVHQSIADDAGRADRCRPIAQLPIGDPCVRRHACRAADRRDGIPRHGQARWSGPAQKAARCRRRRTPRRCGENAFYVAPGVVQMPAPDRLMRSGDVRADPLRNDLRRLRRGDRAS